ncbi:MAG: hypothetical protein RLZZ175_1089 [Bacteroidota bacterium]|jgi:hypothetical protein
MKNILILILLTLSIQVFAQQNNKVDLPKGVIYKYCDSITFQNAKKIIIDELDKNPNYILSDDITFVGPILWSRFKKSKELKSIEGGDVTLLVDNTKLSGKMTQNLKDSKKIWDELRNEINGKDFILRKATFYELQYYWSVISFDIEEPLIIIETKKHNYILNISPKNFKLFWIDEAPKK